MPKLATTDFDLSIAEEFLKRRKLRHLHAKRRADTLTLTAGPSDDPWPRARFRLLTKQRWTLDVADAPGRWEPTPFQASLRDLRDLVADTFSWVLTDPESGTNFRSQGPVRGQRREETPRPAPWGPNREVSEH